jgi:hypothetical protein
VRFDHRVDRLLADRDGARAQHFKKFGADSIISKEASWAVIRDKLTIGENQATHADRHAAGVDHGPRDRR